MKDRGKVSFGDNKYFEGVLQLRNSFPEARDFVIRHVEKEEGVWISKLVERKTDSDFFLSSNKFLIRFAKKIHSNFGGLMKVSRKLFSQDKQTSKQIWRVTVVVRFFEFQKEDVVLFTRKDKRQLVRIRTISGSRINGVDLAKQKSTFFSYKDEQYEILEVRTARVTKVYPHLEVMNPFDYQSQRVENPVEVKLGQDVEIVCVDDLVWLV